MIIDLRCDSMQPDQFGLSVDQTVSVNVSRAGISEGSTCSFRGCLFDSETLKLLRLDSSNSSCVVARKIIVCLKGGVYRVTRC